MIKDFTNQRFSRLLVIKNRPDLKKGNKGPRVVECICDCGTVKTATLKNLKKGYVKSCGCLQKERIGLDSTKHGLYKLPEYNIWNGIVQRCYNNKNDKYIRYGNKGITMSPEWKDNFEIFLKDMGPRPSPKHSIDRRENNKGYSKENCRWATSKEQNNNRTNNIFYEYDGKTKTLSEWCSELNLNYMIIYGRIHRGLTFKEAIQNIHDKLFTFNPCADNNPPETMSLNAWCVLLGLPRYATYLRILRGESFESIVAE